MPSSGSALFAIDASRARRLEARRATREREARGRAERLLGRVRDYLEGLAPDAAGDPGLEREIAGAWERIGDLQGESSPVRSDAGGTAEAAESYRKARGIYARLARAARPGDPRALADLATVEAKLGDTLAALGRDEAALASYAAALEGFEPLVEGDAAPLGPRANLTICLCSLASLEARRGDRHRAEERLARAEGIARASPASAAAKVDLALASQRTGDALLAAGDPRESARRYEEAGAALEPLVRSDPANLELRRNLALTLARLASAWSRCGRADRAGPCYDRAIEAGEELLRLDRASDAARRDLAVLLDEFADHLIAGAGENDTAPEMVARLRKARSSYRRSLELFLEMGERGALPAPDTALPGALRGKIAACDEAIEKLAGR